MRAEEAKIVQEKAAKIKEWVTLKLAEVGWELGGPGLGLLLSPCVVVFFVFLPPSVGRALPAFPFINHLSPVQLRRDTSLPLPLPVVVAEFP